MEAKLGFIGIIQEELRNSPLETLKWASSLGYDGMEGAASLVGSEVGSSAAEVRRTLADLGLTVPVQGRVAQDQSDKELGTVIETAVEIGAAYVVDYYASFESASEILQYAEFANRVGRRCADAGVAFLYHNHNQEMRFHNGRRGIDIFLSNTDPALVNVELDAGWVAYGGGNPVELIDAYPNRFPVLHMKDFVQLSSVDADPSPARKAAVFTEVGTGAVDMAGVVEAAARAKVAWLIVEQDRMNTLSPKDSLATSYANLARLVR